MFDVRKQVLCDLLKASFDCLVAAQCLEMESADIVLDFESAARYPTADQG
jgi:hypothetical protein